MQQKAFLKLMGLNYRLVYRKGHDNKAVDALSRPCTTEDSNAISVSTPKCLEIIVEGYQEDPQAKQLLTELSIASPNSQGFALVDGLIKHKGRIWLGHHTEAQQAIMLALHSSGLGGHSGITATYHKIKALFSWPNMKQDIHKYVKDCQVCSQAKPEHCRLPGLLQPLPIPSQAWHTASLDFIEGLPKSKTFDTRQVLKIWPLHSPFSPIYSPVNRTVVSQPCLQVTWPAKCTHLR
jgi:hypothetical protein